MEVDSLNSGMLKQWAKWQAILSEAKLSNPYFVFFCPKFRKILDSFDSLDSIVSTLMRTAKIYQVKSKKLAGTNYSEVHKKAFGIYSSIKKRSKRRAYIRSAYFSKDKIFLSLFWHHLKDKHHKDRMRRLKYFHCAIELIRYSKINPISLENPNKSTEILHRFYGLTPNKNLFVVQIKELKRNNQKYLISVFPY